MRVPLTQVLDSQTPLLAADGGAVPELSSRDHFLRGFASVKTVAESLFMSGLHFLRDLEPTHQRKVNS